MNRETIDNTGDFMMSETKINMRHELAENFKSDVTEELSQAGKNVIHFTLQLIQEKICKFASDIILNEKEEKEVINYMSTQLAEKGLIPQSYANLSDEDMIRTLKQESYEKGMAAEYALAVTSLIDNNAPKELIYNVRDNFRANLKKQKYNDFKKIAALYHDEKFQWFETNGKQ